jgi:hypothetical protein
MWPEGAHDLMNDNVTGVLPVRTTYLGPRTAAAGFTARTLETKARFIQQVMTGYTAVRSAEDLEGGALTYAEIKAIASGNPVVMEKVRIDTEVRKLDQLRAVHLNQQHNIRWQLRHLPREIADARKTIDQVRADMATRDAHEGEEFGEEFVMTVGK